jgi:malate dehydrogenase (oxaloacetate-decarboxylating)
MVDKDVALAAHERAKGKIEMIPKVRISSNEDLALYYTPGVAYVATAINEDKLNAVKYTSKANTIAVVSDGTRLLGLGKMGPEAALPVMETKALLYKKYAGIDAVPLCIDTTDEAEIIKFVRYIAPTFGGVNIEDLESPKCFRVVDELAKTLPIPVLHDDQHGTAVVGTAALINALRLAGKPIPSVKIVINGAGAAGLGFVRMFSYMKIKNVYVADKAGLIYEGRPDHMNDFKDEIAKTTNPERKQGQLADALEGADVLIGASSANAFTKEMIGKMNKDPIVFALANPIPEISYADAKEAGAFIAATGNSAAPNQINNMLGFPAIMRGLLDAGVKSVTYEMLYSAAKALAKSAGRKITQECILPNAGDRRQMAKAVAEVAVAIAGAAIASGNAKLSPTPEEIRQSLSAKLKRYAKIEGRIVGKV